jgi:hypothetical protein
MKTNNISKKSFLTSLIMVMTAGLYSMKHGGDSYPSHNTTNGYIGGGSPIYYPRRTHFKGYQRENRRSTFNKNK